MKPLNNYQICVLNRIGENTLANGDEGSPQWWVEGGGAVRGPTAMVLIKRGLLKLTGHAGGHPGVDYFHITDAGRKIIAPLYA